jgi:hypothetical protein
LPQGFVQCPVCLYPARTLKDGHTIRRHTYQRGPCPGVGQVVENPPNGVYIPDRIVYSAKAVECPACEAKVGQDCMTKAGKPITFPHTARLTVYIARGEPVALIEGEGESPADIIAAAKTLKKARGRTRVSYLAVPCPDCHAEVDEHCKNVSSTHVSRKRMAVRKYNADYHGIEYPS